MRFAASTEQGAGRSAQSEARRVRVTCPACTFILIKPVPAPYFIAFSLFLFAVMPLHRWFTEVLARRGEAKRKMRQQCKERTKTDSVTGIEREKEIQIKWKKAIVVEWLC
jgi:hypothetical protein